MARTAKATQNEVFIELTQEAYDDLLNELNQRKGADRDAIAEEIAVARELGDLRENQAYTFAMEKKERNENRISELEDMLKKAKIIKSNSTKVVQIGTTVQIKNLETNKAMTITLVGSEETQAAKPGDGKLSIDSPIGKAVYNSKVGETVKVVLPAKSVEYKVVKIV